MNKVKDSRVGLRSYYTKHYTISIIYVAKII